jgi:hypothetical protein
MRKIALVVLVGMMVGWCAGAQNYDNFPQSLYRFTDLTLRTDAETLSVSGAGGTFALDATTPSPIGGSSYKLHAANLTNTQGTITLNRTVTAYPMIGLIIKTNSTSARSLPNMRLSDGTNIHDTAWASYSDTAIVKPSWGHIANEWRIIWIPSSEFILVAGTVAWATTEDNRAKSVTLLRFNIPVTCPGNGVEGVDGVDVWIGGILTYNHTKAKVVMICDDFPDTVNSVLFPRLQAKGWKANVAPAVTYIGSPLMDTEAARARIQQLYNAGWDVCNHSYAHDQATNLDDSGTADTLRYEVCNYKRWARTYGWNRGADFFVFPGQTCQLATSNGGDIADNYASMGFGITYRTMYGAGHYRYASGITTFIPNDMLAIPRYNVTTTSNTDYNASGLKTTLAAAVLRRGVLVLMFHGFKENSPAAGTEISITMLDAFLADLQTRVSAGTTEVVTLTDWYNEINEVTTGTTITGKSTPFGSGGGVFGN